MRFAIFILIGLFAFSCRQTPAIEEDTSTSERDWAFPYFEKADSLNPILLPSSQLEFTDPITGNVFLWEERNVLNPTAVVKDEKIHLLYRAQDKSGTSRIGLAISSDGLHFEKHHAPVFYPDEDTMKMYEWNYRKSTKWPAEAENCHNCYFDGVEDPRIIENQDGNYIMTYTAYDGKTARLSIASSNDLLTWVKHGLAFNGDSYREMWSKAGAIVAERLGNKIIAKKINGKYWMYFGDTDIYLATSDDLIKWDILENEENSKMVSVLHPRPGYFDSRLVEPGPYALLQDEGIVLIYNSSNAANNNDPNLPVFTYAAGQALFDKNIPYKLTDRTESYFIYPDKDYEKVGEVNEVCFVEGLVYFRDKWFLYYGTADSKIAVAIYDPK